MIKKQTWKHMSQTEAVKAFCEGEAVTVVKRIGSIKCGYQIARYEGKVKRLLINTVRVEWHDKQGVVHVDRLSPERLEKRG